MQTSFEGKQNAPAAAARAGAMTKATVRLFASIRKILINISDSPFNGTVGRYRGPITVPS